MNDDTSTTGPAPGHDLRTATNRLADVRRKCRSVGSRNLEATEMEQRIDSILEQLAAADDPDADPVRFSDLARQLYAVERFFETNGFLSVAKEVAHVERTLEGLAPADEEPVLAVDPGPSRPAPSAGDPPPTGADVEAEPPPSRWAIPKPVAAIMVFFVVAVAVCVVVILRHTAPAGPPEPLHLPPTPTPAPAIPTAVVEPSPARATDGPAPGAILAEAVGRARLALADGDVDEAIDQLSRAALVDADHATVLGTARQIVDLLVERAEAAADGGLWQIADLTIARAGRIATRFGLDTHRIDQAARRFSQMPRFTLVQPGDTAAIRAAEGRRVTVYLADGSTQQSVIKGVEAGALLLDEDTEVRGGALYYVERIPLADVDYLKVWAK